MSRRPEFPLGLLARWYAAPLAPEAARCLLASAEAREQARLRRGAPCRTCELQRLVACFWLGANITLDYPRLSARLAGTAHGRLLLRHILGQLLMACRRPGGFEHLADAFEASHHLFRPGDYFVVLDRLGLLRHLPPTPEPAPAANLEVLLTTARVARRLGVRDRPPHDRSDTFG